MKQLPRIQDDLYEAINGEWLEKAVIPEDRPVTGGFSVLDEEVEKLLMKDFADFASGKKACPEILGMKDAIALYRKVLDTKRREEEGAKPVLPILEKIKELKDIEDFSKKAKDLYFDGVELPFSIYVEVDMADATKYSLCLVGPSIILPDTTYYAPEHPAKAMLLPIYAQMVEQALAFSPLSEEERKLYIQDTLAFDELVSKSVKSQLEWADYVKNYNPTSLKELQEEVAPFDMKRFLEDLFEENTPETVVVFDPRAFKEFKNYFNEENFEMFKHWCYVRSFMKSTPCLSLTLRHIGSIYRRALMGVEKDPELEKDAYRVVSSVFSESIGVYYGREYFGEEAKKDVVELVHKIIDTYKKRVREGFLSEQTKEKAILKLSTIEVKMGYPDFVREIYGEMKVDEADSYFEALKKIEVVRMKDSLSRLPKKVDRSEWVMPGHMVNACYNPNMNDITFPAAILQKPFYSLHQLPEENLGGIGAVIGHEISHAFDNNGANFDENGNLASWWKEEDFEEFKKQTQRMIDQWEGIPFHGGKVNGELVVSENIADNGGVAVTLEIMHTLKNPSFQAYFKNWARIWCQKAKEEYISLLLQNDVHSPAKLRANIQIRNFKEWYEAFDVKPTDEMFIPEDKRIIIW